MWQATQSVQDAGGGETYPARQVLDAPTLRTLHDLNRMYLANAAPWLRQTGAEASANARLGYAATVLALPAAARSLAADCPYTLFNLRFDDGSFWRSVAVEHRPGASASTAAGAFARAAVFLAWHLVRSCELAAPLALGMAASVMELMRALPVSALDEVAAAALPFLAPRWADHERFWSTLASAACTANSRELGEVRLLGMQLLAADGLRARFGPAPSGV